MDLEQLSKDIKIDTSMSADIAQKCNELLDIQKEVSELEDKLKKVKAAEIKLSENDIPNLMQQAGIQLLKLNDGSSVEVKPYYAAIIKNNVTLTFGRSQDNEAKSLVDELRNKGHNVKQAEKVEPMTLKGFVRDEIENGRNVPADLFGVYVATRTKIKTKE